MPSVDVNLDLQDVLMRAALQNSVSWVLHDVLCVLRQLRHDEAHVWTKKYYQLGDPGATKKDATAYVETALMALEPELLRLILESKENL